MYFSTFSIVAYDPITKGYGIGVASKFLAVGAYVPYARAGAGAVATQAHVNLAFGIDGLDLMAKGLKATEVKAWLIEHDHGCDERQFGLVDAFGNADSYTGRNCMHWAGSCVGSGYAIQGNILKDEYVLPAMKTAFENTIGELEDRLFAALKAGDDNGGDRRGKQSAALMVVRPNGGYGGNNDRYLDLRVDDHPAPITEIQRLLKLHRLYFGKSDPAHKIALTPNLIIELQQIMQKEGYYHAKINGDYDAVTRSAWRAFTGTENLEARVDLDAATIDPPALEYIRTHF